ncbi:TPR end-of-group domain-containing protein [Pontibacter sp. MBLB2868]|uniref:TPR end-of-group domain-containing protein n=1 Tax=Pontibacter sp. MBLB2868 TaxID=3451555 RepID=UPI003F74DFB5
MNSHSCIAQRLETGKLIQRVQTITDTSQSYALYLPTTYEPSEQWPIIYIFDPAARGALAASKFRYAAEKYGYIVVASNNSRNGDWSYVEDAMAAMAEDTHRRFSINEMRKYSSGFSGGARAAVYMALKTREIVGVIACGAGFPQVIGGPANPAFDFAGIVGDKDANYYELHVLYNELEKQPGNELLITFDGGHQWPDSTLVAQGVAWLELQAMRHNLIPQKPAFVAEYINQVKEKIAEEKNPAERYFLVKQLYNSVVGLTDVTTLQGEVQNLEKSAEVKQALTKRREIEALEGELWKKYSQALSSITPAISVSDTVNLSNRYDSPKWWQNELKDIQKRALRLDAQEGSLLYERIKSYIWIAAVESFEQAWRMEQLDQALQYLQIAGVVRADSPEPYFYLAKIYSKQRKYKQALKSLEEAVKRGMTRYELITEDDLFEPLQKRKGYDELITQMRRERNKKSE